MVNMDTQTLSFGLTLITIPILFIIYIVWLVGRNMGNHSATTRLMETYQLDLAHRVKFEKDDFITKEKSRLLTQGEKVGYEKGYETGRQEAHQNLRRDFILFLEEQLRILKNGQLEGIGTNIKSITVGDVDGV